MTTRVQALRSSTSGAVPAAGSRLPGELWSNFPDLQLGVIDASKNAQKLIAVRYFSTTANYATGDFVIQAGALYAAKGAITAGAFNSTQWVKIAAATDADGPYLAIAGGTLTGALLLAADPGAALGAATKQYVDGKVTAAPFLPIAGGTLTGPVILSGPPTVPLHAATKAYVDAGAFMPVAGGANTGLNDNRIINGDCRVDQRNNGASGTAINAYTIDRWKYAPSLAAKGTWGRASSTVPGFPYCLGFTSSSAYAVLAADFFSFFQAIEADMISDFAWGTSNAQSVTLSFWAASSLTGTFGGVVQNYASTRSYPFTYSIPAANIWTRIVVIIPGDTGGTWVMSGNAGSLALFFDLGSGATYRAAAGAWANGNYVGATGAQSILATNGASFNVTGVKLEIGSVATFYNRQSMAKVLADCQRYYTTGAQVSLRAYGSAGQGFQCTYPLKVSMRAAPTTTVNPITTTNCSTFAIISSSQDAVDFSGTVVALGAFQAQASFTASAEL